MKVILIGPDNKRSVVDPNENATVRDVATYKYHLSITCFGGSPGEITLPSLQLLQRLWRATLSP